MEKKESVNKAEISRTSIITVLLCKRSEGWRRKNGKPPAPSGTYIQEPVKQTEPEYRLLSLP